MADQAAPVPEIAGSVDTAPINKLERQNSLEKHLKLRPDEKDLRDRHILLDTSVAPALQAKQAELEKQRITDNLKKGLAKRPEKDELVGRNILPKSSAAPALQEKERELKYHMRQNSLEKSLQKRPTADELVKDGILQADENPVENACRLDETRYS